MLGVASGFSGLYGANTYSAAGDEQQHRAAPIAYPPRAVEPQDLHADTCLRCTCAQRREAVLGAMREQALVENVSVSARDVPTCAE